MKLRFGNVSRAPATKKVKRNRMQVRRIERATAQLADPEFLSRLLALRERLEGRPAFSEEARAAARKAALRPDIQTEDQGLYATAFAAGPRARAILRGKAIAASDLRKSGGSYDLEEVRRLLNGVTRQSIEKRVREGKLLAVPGPNNRRFYPVAQFTDDGSVVEGLQSVSKALPTENGFAILNFLVNPNSQLGNAKPIDLLKNGEIEKVVEAAERYGEQGA